MVGINLCEQMYDLGPATSSCKHGRGRFLVLFTLSFHSRTRLALPDVQYTCLVRGSTIVHSFQNIYNMARVYMHIGVYGFFKCMAEGGGMGV